MAGDNPLAKLCVAKGERTNMMMSIPIGEINDFGMIIIAGTSRSRPTKNLSQTSRNAQNGVNWTENGLLTISLKVSVRFSERNMMSF